MDLANTQPMHRSIALAFALTLTTLWTQASARPAPTPVRSSVTSSSVTSPGRRMLQLWRQARQQPGAQLGTRLGTRAMVKGRTYSEFPALLKRQARPMTKKQRHENADATFRGTHPMFKRLVSSGWYRQPGKIAELQRMANNLRQTRTLSGGKQLSQVEYLAFDLEATNGSAGRFHKGRQRVLAGWDEVAQFGYTIYRGGQKVRSGTIDIKPDVQISNWVQDNCKLTPKTLANAPRFEAAAKQILGLMQGRVLIGQSAVKKDWSWLQSNFARLGVNLPGPKKLILDTHYLSFNHFPQGAGLKNLSQHFRVNQTNHHNARYDAEATGDVFFSMMRKSGTSTLGQAFARQQQGYDRMKNPLARGAARPAH
jgi:DNA polymerase III epsilon subunit-like protein